MKRPRRRLRHLGVLLLLTSSLCCCPGTRAQQVQQQTNNNHTLQKRQRSRRLGSSGSSSAPCTFAGDSLEILQAQICQELDVSSIQQQQQSDNYVYEYFAEVLMDPHEAACAGQWVLDLLSLSSSSLIIKNSYILQKVVCKQVEAAIQNGKQATATAGVWILPAPSSAASSILS